MGRQRWGIRAAVILVALGIGACSANRPIKRTVKRPLTAAELREFWVDRGNIASLDLYWGASPADLKPKPDDTFKFRKEKVIGYSHTYDLVDSRGMKWAAKLGPEAKTEVVASRIYWAVGYHQPPTYFVPEWKLEGSQQPGIKNSARFRPDLPGGKLHGTWSLFENQFIGTQPYRGLLVLDLILNNWDIKDEQNKVYVFDRPRDGARRWFVSRDLGASFGAPKWPDGSRDNIDDFEKHPFITKVNGDHLEFGYVGRHGELMQQITRRDVRWMALRLAQITDRQWERAFNAGSYAGPELERYVARIKQKISEGLALCPNGC